jgi:hypothetical protein
MIMPAWIKPANPYSVASLGSFSNTILRLRSGQALQQNAQAYVPRKALTTGVSADNRAVFNAREQQEAEELGRKQYRSLQ